MITISAKDIKAGMMLLIACQLVNVKRVGHGDGQVIVMPSRGETIRLSPSASIEVIED